MYSSLSGEILTMLFDTVIKAGAPTREITASPGQASVQDLLSASSTSFCGMVTVASSFCSMKAGKAGGAIQGLREHLMGVLMAKVARCSA